MRIKSNRGFTLIEVLVTIAILATLTVMTTQSISQAIKAKTKLQGQLGDVSKLRDALRLIERDINLAYHYRDIEKEIADLVKKSGQPAVGGVGGGAGGNTGPADNGADAVTPAGFVPAPQAEAPRKSPATHFVGTGEELDFVTMNNARILRNVKQAEFVEVGYSVRDCKGLSGGSSKCIWRRSSPHVDLDVTEGGDEFVLLENVSEFKLRYIGKTKQDWTGTWRSDEGGDGATKGNFPQAVEVSITTEKEEKGRKKKYSMQLIVPVHFPNNPEEKTNARPSTSPNL